MLPAAAAGKEARRVSPCEQEKMGQCSFWITRVRLRPVDWPETEVGKRAEFGPSPKRVPPRFSAVQTPTVSRFAPGRTSIEMNKETN